LCDKTNPDVILMDMVLPGDMDGVATTEAVRKQFPHIQVVALSTFYDSTLVKSVMQAGAIGYLVKGVSGEGLAQAIRSAYAGRPAMGKEAVDVLLQPAKITEPTPEFNLTTREQDVLALLVDGLANAEIAAQLHISVSAIKYHVGNIFSKLAVNNRTEAAAKARQYNLF